MEMENQIKMKKEAEQIFTNIYKNNGFNGKESISGPGSDTYQTRIIIKEIPLLFKDYNISTMLDIPCGDFYWMKEVDLKDIEYIGADIVDDLIKKNNKEYHKNNLYFKKLDLLKDTLPNVDLIFTRDCLVHLSFEDIFNALTNICNSNSKYLLSTTFTERTNNNDIKTGQWRTLNLEVEPFFLPKPIKIINEGCTENEGIYSDKSLGFWKISDIRKSLK